MTHNRIINYTPDPLFQTPGVPRILRLRHLTTLQATTPREAKELRRLEATQQDMEYDWHRRQRKAEYQRLHAAAILERKRNDDEENNAGRG